MYESGVVTPSSPTASDRSQATAMNILRTDNAQNQLGSASENDLSVSAARGQQRILDGIRQPQSKPMPSNITEPNIPGSNTRRDQKRLLEQIQKQSTRSEAPSSKARSNTSPSSSLHSHDTLDDGYPGGDYSMQYPRGAYGQPETYTYTKKRLWRTLGIGSLVEVPATDGSGLPGVLRWLSRPVDESYPPPWAGVELVSTCIAICF